LRPFSHRHGAGGGPDGDLHLSPADHALTGGARPGQLGPRYRIRIVTEPEKRPEGGAGKLYRASMVRMAWSTPS
ncbi:hypothetical protein, partial [Escherichia coli]|uniref:hypothetical protein n=1 Tax=Escherichia coli TaxID=562 RepID=UPI0019D68625